MITVRNATIKDAVELAPRLREADVQESTRAHGTNCLLQHLMVAATGPLGTCRVAEVDGVVEAMFGARDSGDGRGIVWFVGSPVVDRHSLTMCKIGQAFVETRDFPVLFNYVDAENTAARKWLRWLGFTEKVEVLVGTGNHKFYYFEKVKDHV